MAITAKNLAKHELTGSNVEVVKSTDPNKVGIKGTVVEESKYMLIINTGAGEKKIPKKECTFRFTFEKEKVDIKGEGLLGKPEERIKRQN